MAKVQVQVVVDRKQVDKLSSDLDKLNNKKINIETKEFSQNLKDAEKALNDLGGEASKLTTVFNPNGDMVKSVEEFKDGIAKTITVTRKLNKESGDLEETQTKIVHNIEKEKAAQDKATQSTKTANEEVKKQGLLYDILGRSVSSFLARMVAYRAVYAGIRAVTNGFKEALETLKEVDTELVTVRKVTGFDQWQMAGVEEQAYAVASKYGTSAADYTSGVAAFARAGYKDLSGDLAELAEKTKIVGDTTADVAQQFLLSVDAAYQYKGNIEKLTAVLDGANEIDNKFATSIEKIAEGMGIVAPVAAQMHVSVDELAAGIGTITAVTQRTGTEAARALRAIFLNIVGDTKTEIEEGVTWTTGEIEGLRDVIKLYAKDAWDAAQASEGIIDPMKAIEGLHKSVEAGVLSEAKLMEMVSDIGGKLRTSQLLAIVNNWDMYESMLETYRNAYGSADKEIENAMDSWTRKTEVLKNKWTEFVKTGLDSKAFKGALDALTWFVERLGTLPGLLTRLIPLFAALKLRDMAKNMDSAAKAASSMADGMKAVGSTAKTLNWISLILTAISLAWNAIAMKQENDKIKHQEMVQKLYEEAEAAKESSNSMLSLYADFNSATEGSNALTESAKKLAEALGTDIPEGAAKAGDALAQLVRDNLIASVNKLNTQLVTAQGEFVKASSENDLNSEWSAILHPTGYKQVQKSGDWMPDELRNKIDEITGGLSKRTPKGYQEIFNTTNLEDALNFRDAMAKISAEFDEYIRKGGDASVLNQTYYTQLQDYLHTTEEAYNKLKSSEQDLDSEEMKLRFLDLSSTIRVDSVEAYEKLIKTINLKNRGSNEEREALIALAEIYYPQYAEQLKGAADEEEDVAEAVKDETDALYANQKALEANATATEKAAAAKKDAEAAVAQFCDALFDENGELTATGKAALTASQYLADLTQAELNARLEMAKANYANLRAQLAAVATDALKAAYALIALEDAAAENGIIENEAGRLRRKAGGADSLLRQLKALESTINSTSVQATAVNPYTSGYSASTGSSGGRSSGKSSSTSTEDKKLKSLQERVTLLKSELSLMKERGDSEESQISKMRQIQSALKAEWEYLKSIKGDQATINGLMQEWWSIENSVTSMMDDQAKSAQEQADALQKALEAQLALNNALKDRSVRYYNAKTGQWEWGANQQNVQSAYSAYQSAIAGLPAEQQAVFARQGMAMTGYGANSTLSELLSQISNGGGASTYNYGPTFNLGGISLTEAQAKAMTVFDFAMLSNSLVIHS